MIHSRPGRPKMMLVVMRIEERIKFPVMYWLVTLYFSHGRETNDDSSEGFHWGMKEFGKFATFQRDILSDSIQVQSSVIIS